MAQKRRYNYFNLDSRTIHNLYVHMIYLPSAPLSSLTIVRALSLPGSLAFISTFEGMILFLETTPRIKKNWWGEGAAALYI